METCLPTRRYGNPNASRKSVLLPFAPPSIEPAASGSGVVPR